MGLLSRYILIQGDEEAERSRAGPHVRVEGTANIRGVQAFRAGQVGSWRGLRTSRAAHRVEQPSAAGAAGPLTSKPPSARPLCLQMNVIGAYPFHWHLVGDASGQVATDNSVYRHAAPEFC